MKKFTSVFVNAATVIAVVSVSGCATFIRGSTQNVAISTSPDNAFVEIFDRKGEKVADAGTPATVLLKRGAGYFRSARYRVEISKNGYERQIIHITSGVNGWYIVGIYPFAYIFFGWLIVDPITGAMWTLKPKEVHVNLHQNRSYDNSGNTDEIRFVLKDQIPEDTFAELDLVRIK